MKPCTAILFGMLAAAMTGDTQADWRATGVDDNGWFEYEVKVKRNPYDSDRAKIEYYHYGTGETRSIWLRRDDLDDDYFERHGPGRLRYGGDE